MPVAVISNVHVAVHLVVCIHCIVFETNEEWERRPLTLDNIWGVLSCPGISGVAGATPVRVGYVEFIISIQVFHLMRKVIVYDSTVMALGAVATRMSRFFGYLFIGR